MIKRIFLKITHNNRYLIRICFYLMVFVMACSSFILFGLADTFESYVSSNVNLDVIVQSDYNSTEFFQKYALDLSPDYHEEYIYNTFDFVDFINKIGKDTDCYYDVGVKDLFLKSYDHVFSVKHANKSINREDILEEFPDGFSDEMDFVYQMVSNYFLSLQPYVISTNATMPYDLYVNSSEIIDGRLFTQQEIDEGSAVCLAPANAYGVVYKDNEWIIKMIEPGDLVDFSARKWGIDADTVTKVFEVVGLYDDTHVDDGLACRLYIPHQAFVDMFKQYTSSAEDLGKLLCPFTGLDAFFNPGDLKQLNHLMNLIENEKPAHVSYFANTNDYAKLLGCISAIKNNIENIGYFVGVLSIIVLSLGTILFVQSRLKETALYLSFGSDKKTLLIEWVIEELLCAVISLPLVLFISKKASLKVYEYIVANSVLSETSVFESFSSYTSGLNMVNQNINFSSFGFITVLFIANLLIGVIIVNKAIKNISVKELLKSE